MKLDPLPKGLLEPELERMLSDQIEYEGWQEADTLYTRVHPSLEGREAKLRARALMDHARVLRRLEKVGEASAMEARAEALVGGPIEREEEPKSSVDELKEREAKPSGLKGLFKGMFGG